MRKPRPREITFTYVRNVSMTPQQFDTFMNKFLKDKNYYLKYTMTKGPNLYQWFHSNTYDITDTMSDIAHRCWVDEIKEYLKENEFSPDAVEIKRIYQTLTD